MENEVRTAVINACRKMMIPIARFLLRNGVGFREFAEVAKWAFVKVASDDYGIGGRPTNMSRVSVMTGLSRKEVKRQREAHRDFRLHDRHWNRASTVLNEWYFNPKFTDDRGEPLVLNTGPEEPSFGSLVKTVGADVPAGAILHELKRANSVQMDEEGRVRACSRLYAPLQSPIAAIRHTGNAVHFLASTINHNLGSGDRGQNLFERVAWTTRLNPKKFEEFRAFVAGYATPFVESVNAWLAANEVPMSEESRRFSTGLGLYLFRSDYLSDFDD